MKNNFKMKNESEFIFDDILNNGWTSIPNSIFNDSRLKYESIGLYCTILKYKNIPGWKIYQKTLVNEFNGKTKVMSCIKQLVECGYIKKIKIRNEKGQLCGMLYKVYSKSINPIENPESLDESQSEPKSDFPTSEKPTSENQPLINKDLNNKDLNNDCSSSNQIEKNKETDYLNIKNKIKNTYKKLTKADEVNLLNLQKNYDYNLILKAVDIAIENGGKTIKYIKGILEYWKDENLKTSNEIDEYILKWKNKNKQAKYNYEKKIEKMAQTSVNNENSNNIKHKHNKSSFNFKQRKYTKEDFKNLENTLLGLDKI